MAKMKSVYIVAITAAVFFVIGVGFSRIPAEMMHERGSMIAVMMLAFPGFYGLRRIFNQGRTALIIISLGIFSLLIETIGIHTGFPYSHFEYTLPFGYQLFGTTPWTVFVAWSPLVIGAYFLSRNLRQSAWKQFFMYLVILVSIDLVLDPGAVARGLWVYDSGGAWFGVPVQNFLGWVFSGSIAYFILHKLVPKNITFNKKSIAWLATPLVVCASLWSGATFGYGLLIPGIIGIVLVVWYLQKLHTNEAPEFQHIEK